MFMLYRLHKYNLDLISKASTNSSIHKGDDAPVRRFGFDHPVYIGSAYVVEPVWEDDWLVRTKKSSFYNYNHNTNICVVQN